MRARLPGTLALVFFWFVVGVHAQECGGHGDYVPNVDAVPGASRPIAQLTLY
jgi:hypothetical protein